MLYIGFVARYVYYNNNNNDGRNRHDDDELSHAKLRNLRDHASVRLPGVLQTNVWHSNIIRHNCI